MHRTIGRADRRAGSGRSAGRPRRSGRACRPAAGTPGRRGPPRAAAPGPRRLGAAASARSAGLPGAGPGADGLLQQPQAHHVAQVADRAVDPGLVGEVRPRGSPRSAPAGPAPRRPGTRCRRRCTRSRGPAAGTPTTAEAVSCEPTAITGSGRGRPGRGPAGLARGTAGPDRRCRAGAAAGTARREAGAGDQRGRPVPGPRRRSSWVVEALVSSAPTRRSASRPSRSGISSRVPGRGQLRRAAPPRQLVDRVERQLLDPGDRVQLGRRDRGQHLARPRRRCGRRGSAPGCRAARRPASSRP